MQPGNPLTEFLSAAAEIHGPAEAARVLDCFRVRRRRDIERLEALGKKISTPAGRAENARHSAPAD